MKTTIRNPKAAALFLSAALIAGSAAAVSPAYAADTKSNAAVITQQTTAEGTDSTSGTQTKTNLTGEDIEDGSYPVEVRVAAGNLKVSEASLTAENGKLTLHVTEKDGTKSDFTITALDQEERVKNAVIVVLSSSLPDGALKESASAAYQPLEYKNIPLTAGTWKISVSMEGGSGRASVKSPCTVTVDEDGRATATIEWSSSHYDYMIVGGQKYTPVSNTDSSSGTESEAHSVFEIPVAALDEPEVVIADTTAMSQPHEIEYKLTFSRESAAREKEETRKTTAAERIGGIVAVVILAFLGALGFKKLMDRKLL